VFKGKDYAGCHKHLNENNKMANSKVW